MSLWEGERIDQGLLWVGAGSATGIAASMFGSTVPTDFPLLICAVLAAAGPPTACASVWRPSLDWGSDWVRPCPQRI
jgi:hypothetical protein